MLKHEEMPEDNEDLGKIHVSFPHLPDDTPESCPTPLSAILEYLAVEVPDGELLDPIDLHFVRTARVAEQQFWIWRFTDPLGADCYVTVSVNVDGAQVIEYDEDHYHLTPEQSILGVYHQVF